MSSAFQALREHGRPTYYGPNIWPATEDKAIYAIIYAFLAIAFSIYISIIGIRGIERLYVFIRVTVSLFIGAVILLCIFGYGWEYGSVTTKMDYKSFTDHPVHARVGLKIGLRGINVTLLGLPKNQVNETINYNERFSWEGGQGKPGYGPEAGRIQREYRAAQWKGLPYPILWVVEYFTIDEGNFRHGRYYRLAGWYTHISLWAAFPLWILSNVLFLMVIRYGAYYLALTGGCLLLSNILFASIRNSVPVCVRFDSETLVLHYNWCFWLVLIVGLLCVVLAALIIFMDLRFPEEIATFFGVDVLQDYEDYYADPAELGLVPPEILSEPSTSMPMAELKRKSQCQDVHALRKRTMSTRFQRTPQRLPAPTPRDHQLAKGSQESELPVYENLNLRRFDPIGEEEEPITGSEEAVILRDIKSLNQ